MLLVQKGHQRYHWMKEPRIGRSRVELRIVNDRQDARFYYRDDAGCWQIMQPSMEVSQAVSTPSNLRPAVFVYGKGRGPVRVLPLPAAGERPGTRPLAGGHVPAVAGATTVESITQQSTRRD